YLAEPDEPEARDAFEVNRHIARAKQQPREPVPRTQFLRGQTMFGIHAMMLIPHDRQVLRQLTGPQPKRRHRSRSRMHERDAVDARPRQHLRVAAKSKRVIKTAPALDHSP